MQGCEECCLSLSDLLSHWHTQQRMKHGHTDTYVSRTITSGAPIGGKIYLQNIVFYNSPSLTRRGHTNAKYTQYENTHRLNWAWDKLLDRGCRSSQCQSAVSHGRGLWFYASIQSVACLCFCLTLWSCSVWWELFWSFVVLKVQHLFSLLDSSKPSQHQVHTVEVHTVLFLHDETWWSGLDYR